MMKLYSGTNSYKIYQKNIHDKIDKKIDKIIDNCYTNNSGQSYFETIIRIFEHIILSLIKAQHVLIFQIFNAFFITLSQVCLTLRQFAKIKYSNMLLFKQIVEQSESKFTRGWSERSSVLYSSILPSQEQAKEAIASFQKTVNGYSDKSDAQQGFIVNHGEQTQKRYAILQSGILIPFIQQSPYDVNWLVNELNTNEKYKQYFKESNITADDIYNIKYNNQHRTFSYHIPLQLKINEVSINIQSRIHIGTYDKSDTIKNKMSKILQDNFKKQLSILNSIDDILNFLQKSIEWAQNKYKNNEYVYEYHTENRFNITKDISQISSTYNNIFKKYNNKILSEHFNIDIDEYKKYRLLFSQLLSHKRENNNKDVLLLNVSSAVKTANIFTLTGIITKTSTNNIKKYFEISTYYNTDNKICIKSIKYNKKLNSFSNYFNNTTNHIITQVSSIFNNAWTNLKNAEDVNAMLIPANCIPKPGKQYSGSGFSNTIWNHNKLFYYQGDKNIKIDIPETLIQIQVQQQIAPPQIKITQLTDEQRAKLEKDKNATATVNVDADTLAKINKEKSDKITAMKQSSANVSQPTNVKETLDKHKDEKQNDEMSQLTERSIDEYISTRNIQQLIKFKDTAGIPGIKPDQLNPDN